MFNRALIIMAVGTLFCSTCLRADSILLDNSVLKVPTGENDGLSFQEAQYLAQQFLFAAPGSISSLSLNFIANPNGAFNALLQITNAIGPATTIGNILGSTGVTIPGGLDSAVLNVPFSLSLGAGTFYLVLSTTDSLPLQTRWQFTQGMQTVAFQIIGTSSDPNFEASVGSAFFSQSQNIDFPVASNFLPIIGGGQIPEPGTLLLLATGIAGILGRLRARNRY